MDKQTVPHESTAHKLSYEWSHTRVLSTYIKVKNTIIERCLLLEVKGLKKQFLKIAYTLRGSFHSFRIYIGRKILTCFIIPAKDCCTEINTQSLFHD